MSSATRGMHTLALALAVLAATACAGDGSEPPTVLSDGSSARSPPVALEGVDRPTILTRVRVLQPSSVMAGTPTARCIDSAAFAGSAVVERVGVSGPSVTVLGPGNHVVYGCDGVTADATEVSSWCGYAFGRLDTGRLRDPRLGLTCRGNDDELLGYAWIQPRPAAAYVVVLREGYGEVYPVASRMPVRIVTDRVDQGTASAAFSVSEHGRDGRRLAAYELEARVSG